MIPNKPYHNHPQIPSHSVCFLFKSKKKNCWKCWLAIQWCTLLTPTHLLHWFDMFHVTLHVKNKWLTYLSSKSNITHDLFVIIILLLLKLSFVAILFMKTLHTKCWANRRALACHILLNTRYSFPMIMSCNIW